MAVSRKPKTNAEKDVGKFIDNAKASDTAIPQKRDCGKTDNLATIKPQKRNAVKSAKKKLTFYMDSDMYIKWKEYEFKQLQAGKKISFQGVVEKYMAKILK
jgi:hypothetical protein